jgi:hypothetical protein
MARRNKYFECTEDGQMTPHGNPNFIPTLKIYVFWYSRQMDGDINPGGLSTPAPGGLEEPFSAVLGSS